MPLSAAQKANLLALSAKASADVGALVPDGGPPPPPPPPPPPVGVRIRVTAAAKVRALPMSSDPGMVGSPQPVGALGTVRAGTVTTNGFRCIDFDLNPPHGWVWPDNFVVI